MSDQTFYITTPIYYVNGRPHIGHAYTTIAADTAARYHRMLGKRVFFLTGTDEHGQKVLQKAEERGMTPKAHCDDMVRHWKAAFEKLNISFDHFMRTTDPGHETCVSAALQSLFDQDLIYKDTYTGWYSTSAERFWTEKDLVDGKCPDTGLPVEKITETNYFFRMSRYQDQLIAHIEANPNFIRPESRKNEVLGFLRKELGDLCISRPKARMSWGIELPFDADYVTYVWFDALLNYVSAVGYHPDGPTSEHWDTFWPASFHLLGKDILTTHSVYWSTMLMALGIPLADGLFAHGWWTTKGEKMSKSLGNVIDVNLLADEFGVDATRYFFLREIRFGADGGFSYDSFLSRYNTDLANDLGNLAHRGLSMSTNWLGGLVPANGDLTDAEEGLRAKTIETIRTYSQGMENLLFNEALAAIADLVSAGNKYVDTTKPWALNKQGDTERLGTVMRHVLETCLVASILLLPVMPTQAAVLLRRVGADPAEADQLLRALLAQSSPDEALSLLSPGSTLTLGDPLFPRFRELPAGIQRLFEAEAPPAKKPKKQPKKQPKKAAPSEKGTQDMEFCTFDDFTKIQLRSGHVQTAEKHPNADRLLVLTVDIGEEAPRTIVAGIANKFSPEELVGRQVVVVANLKPAKLRGIESQGMLLAAGGKEVLDLVSVNAVPGSIVR
jgi:methionyl-tRNA synthetase